MIFKIQDLRNLLFSLNKKQINQIYLKSKNFELTINKNYNILSDTNQKLNPIKNTLNKIENNKINISLNNSKNNKKQIKNISTKDSESYSTIISPMVGTFYRSPAPNEPTFVKQFDIVEKKQVVCIIEAMKLMNEIEAEIHGEIVDILVKDGEIVDCGQGLMKVKQIHKPQ